MDKAQELAKIFFEYAYYHEMNGVPFKPRAYQIASETVMAHGGEVEAAWRRGGVKELKKIPGLGQKTAEKADEFFRTGHIVKYEFIKKKFPVDIYGLSRIEGLGPKHIKDLYKHLKVKNVADLKKALAEDKIRTLAGWGEKSQFKLARQFKLMEDSAGRLLLGNVLPIAEEIISELSKVSGVIRCSYAGSLRRRQETIGDIDLIATTKSPEKVMEAFVNLPQVESIHEQGKTRSSVRLKIGIDADLRAVSDDVYGATLQYFTGDKKHNVMLREYALSKGFTLNEYGLFKLAKNSSAKGKAAASKTEEDLYQALGMDAPPPELRVGGDEIEVALGHRLPKLIPYGSIKGDLQVQTKWSDGALEIEAMAKEARVRGMEYMAVTDHTKSMAFINGLDEERLMKQGKEIDAINKKNKGFLILKGTECDIHKDGDLDIGLAARKKLDWVGISVHSHFKLTREEQTKRLIKAISQPYVDCLFHPTCRIIGKREPLDLDMDEVIATAKKFNVALEINSYPERSDLRDILVRAAVRAGVKLTISSDAHAPEHFDFIKFGEAIARRGWAQKSDILNAKNSKQFLAWLDKKKT